MYLIMFQPEAVVSLSVIGITLLLSYSIMTNLLSCKADKS